MDRYQRASTRKGASETCAAKSDDGVMRAAVWLLIAATLIPMGCGGGSLSGQEQVSFVTVDTDPDWSPDGRLIAFASSRNTGGIYVIRPDGTGLRRVFRGGASNVDWSPDGRRIAFQDRGISMVRFDGGRPTRVLRGTGFSLPAWSPSGDELAVVKDEADLSTAIYVVRSDGKKLRRLLQPQLGRSDPNWTSVAASETEPTWSPDGRQIAFQAGDGHIVVVRLADGRRHEIATGYEPAWSPDGSRVAFSLDDAVWVVAAEGSDNPRRVAPAGGDPSWAPHSDRLVFEVLHHRGRYFRKAESLSIVDATGDDLRKLTFGGSTRDDPGWRRDLAPVP
jgi:Tol biopolymer transport system component